MRRLDVWTGWVGLTAASTWEDGYPPLPCPSPHSRPPPPNLLRLILQPHTAHVPYTDSEYLWLWPHWLKYLFVLWQPMLLTMSLTWRWHQIVTLLYTRSCPQVTQGETIASIRTFLPAFWTAKIDSMFLVSTIRAQMSPIMPLLKQRGLKCNDSRLCRIHASD